MTILRSKENCGTEPTEAEDVPLKKPPTTAIPTPADFVRSNLKEEIAKQVVRKKLAKLRHLVLEKAIAPDYLDSLFPKLLEHFDPQTVVYNGGIANIKEWKVSKT
jgi:hypothetical protein